MAAPLQHGDTKARHPVASFGFTAANHLGWWGGTSGQGVAKAPLPSAQDGSSTIDRQTDFSH